MRTTRTAGYVLAASLATIALPVVLAWYVVGMWDHAGPALRQHAVVTPLWVVGALLADLCFAVLGVVTASTEYATGMIRSTFAAMPDRRGVLAAKAAVVAAVSLAGGEVEMFASYFATRAIVGDRQIRFLATPIGHEIPVLLSLGVGVAVFALVGLGLGFILRSAAGAIVTLIAGFLWLVPVIALHLPNPWGEYVSSVTIPNLAGELSGAPSLSAVTAPMLSSPAAFVVLVAYVAAALGLSSVLVRRRDV